MARKIICDRCGRECEGTHGILSLIRGQFARGIEEPVAQDQFASIDLCDICTEVARTEWGFRIAQPGFKGEFDQPVLIHPGHVTMGPDIEHHNPPEDSDVPRTLAVGMVVDRDIATRWNERHYGSPAPEENACTPG